MAAEIRLSPDTDLDVDPQTIRFKLASDLDLGGLRGGSWDVDRRVPIHLTDKHISMFQRYRDGMRWQDTILFRGRYAARLRAEHRWRGASTLDELATVYEREIDPIFADLKKNGFRTIMFGRPVALPKCHVGRDGEVMIGNQGNHRLGMAMVIGLPRIVVRIHTVHTEFADG